LRRVRGVQDESTLTAERRCPNHPNRELKRIQEENYFFRLSKYGDRLLAYYEQYPDFIQPESRRNEIVSLVRGGLEDISISRRNFTWGIDVSWDAEHKIYVWFDALLNYVTGVGYGTDEALLIATGPRIRILSARTSRVFTVHFGRPCCGAQAWSCEASLCPRLRLYQGRSHGRSAEKSRSSLGNVIEPMDIVREFSADAFRYYFMRECPFGGDGEFSFGRFAASYNGDLANNLGNLFSRTLSMVQRYFDGRLDGSREIPPDQIFTSINLREVVDSVARDIESCRYSSALETIWRQVLDTGNRHIEETRPWLLANSAKPEYDLEGLPSAVLINLAEAVRVSAILIKPFLPQSAEKIYAGFNFPVAWENASYDQIVNRPKLAKDLRVTAPLSADGKVAPLFPKIEPVKGK